MRTISGNGKIKEYVKMYFPVRQKMVSSSYEKTIVNAGMDRNEGRKIGLISVFSHIKSEALLRCMSIYRCDYWNDERVYIIRFRLDIWPRDWRVISLTMKRHECLW